MLGGFIYFFFESSPVGRDSMGGFHGGVGVTESALGTGEMSLVFFFFFFVELLLLSMNTGDELELGVDAGGLLMISLPLRVFSCSPC